MESQPEAVSEEVAAPSREEPFLRELDAKLSPFRRVVVYAVHSNKDVRFFERGAGRWIDAALSLTLPNAIVEALEQMRGNLDGIDGVDPDLRRERLVELHQRLVRLDRALGLPLKPRVARKAKKRKLQQVEEESTVPEAKDSGEAAAAAKPPSASEPTVEDDLLLVGDDKPLQTSKKGNKGKRAPVATAKVLWDRRPGVELSSLEMDQGLCEALGQAGVKTTTDLFLMKPKKYSRIKPIRGAGRPMKTGIVAVSGRVLWRRTSLQPDGSHAPEVCVSGASKQVFRWSEPLPWYVWECLVPGEKVVLIGGHTQEECEEDQVEASADLAEALEGDVEDLLVESDPEPTAEEEEVASDKVAADAVEENPEEAVEDTSPKSPPAKKYRNGVVFDAEIVCDDGKNGVRLAEYGLKEVPDREIRALLYAMLVNRHKLRDWLPDPIVKRQRLPSLHDAVCSIHGMGRHESKATARFVFEEALLGQLGATLGRYQGEKERGIPHAILHSYSSQATRFWGQQLTDAQQLVLEEIKRDLRRSTPMRRVVTGEVGSGKSVVALTALSVVAEGKSQVLFLAQSRLYAESSFLFIEPLLRELGLVGRALKGPPTDAVRDAVSRGEVHVLFATKEDLVEPLEFRRLGLLVAEEAVEWGAINALLEGLKSPRPDLLVNSVRPLPVVALLGAYAKFDISFIEDGDRQLVEGVIVDSDKRMAAYEEAAKVLANKEQVCVVFPNSPTTGEDLLDAREALQLVKGLEAEAFEGGRVSLFHGKMSRDERMRAYDDFSHYRSDVLVATHPIEAAPPAPRVTAVVVEQAEHLSMERLQRIQGQLSKSMSPSRVYFVVGADCTAADRERLEAVIAQKSGVELAELLVGEQGPEQKSNIPFFEWFRPVKDRKVLLEARSEVHRMLQSDPWLKRGGLADVSRTLVRRWSRLWDIEAYPCNIRANPPSGGDGGRRRRRRRRKK
jgi:RecG-like helicase